VRSSVPPRYARTPAGSKLDPFKDEIHRLLGGDPRLPGSAGPGVIAPLGFDGGKTIVDDYLREVRPLFLPPPRTFQRTVYRPGRSASSTSGSPVRRSPSATVRPARRGSWSRAWATRAPAPAR